MARCKVLVVEDDPIILLTAVETLRAAGFHVVEAQTADEGAALLAAAGDIVVVFSDIETPGSLDGLGLARLVKTSWPTIGVVLTSGRVCPAADALPGRTCFVGKPYDLDKVATLIAAAAEG